MLFDPSTRMPLDLLAVFILSRVRLHYSAHPFTLTHLWTDCRTTTVLAACYARWCDRAHFPSWYFDPFATSVESRNVTQAARSVDSMGNCCARSGTQASQDPLAATAQVVRVFKRYANYSYSDSNT
jgi:hypothetical protein